MSLSRLRYTKPTDTNMFTKVIQKLYPDLAYKKGYISDDRNLGRTDNEFLQNLADDIDNSKKPAKFSKYGEYIRSLSHRKPQDRNRREFIRALKNHTGQPLSRITVKKTTKTTYDDIVDTDITEVDVEKEYFGSGKLKRERVITRKIPKRLIRRKIVEETVKITYKSYVEENRKVILKNMKDSDDPVLAQFAKEVADLLKNEEWNLQEAQETARESLHRKCRDSETDLFSFSKSKRALEEYKPSLPLSIVLKNRNSDVIKYFEEASDYLPDIENLNDRENLYVKLKFLCDRTYRYSDDLTEKMSLLADECCLETISDELQDIINI